MKKLQKGPIPSILTHRGFELTETYKANPKSAPWRNDELKDALRNETAGKCAYCESSIEDVAPAHVEHIQPKSLFPDLVMKWSNLTLCCPVCNSNKGDYYSLKAALLNPYVDDPSDHITFLGAFAWSKPSSLRGDTTIRKLQLNRTKLLEEREGLLKSIHVLLIAWANTEDDQVRSIMHESIMGLVSPQKPYNTLSLAFIEYFGEFTLE
ncbi:retron system putative HNH endonuclease [Rhodococcus sp. NPDC080181]|uniref:retron system putative HNH endonuclease n=1 Tax=Rhodococcus sp. NPDC080181 TaxID=3155292 RepID=UPI00344FD0BF